MLYANYKPELLYDADTSSDARAAIQNGEIERYRVKERRAGPGLQVQAYPIWSTKPAAGRARRAQETTQSQKNVTERRAKQELELLIGANYKERVDYKVGLDYDRIRHPEQAARDIVKFIDTLRPIYKRLGIPLKYIYVSQLTTQTGRVSKRMHHHLVITSCGNREIIERAWKHGRAHVEPLTPDGNGLIGLVTYLCQHVHGAKRWVCSRNHVRPQPKYPKSRELSRRKSYEIARDYEAARDYFERKYPEYKFLDMQVSYSDFVSGAYMYVRMRRRDAWARQIYQREEREYDTAM